MRGRISENGVPIPSGTDRKIPQVSGDTHTMARLKRGASGVALPDWFLFTTRRVLPRVNVASVVFSTETVET